MNKPLPSYVGKQLTAFGAAGAIGFLANIFVTAIMKDSLGLPVESAYLAGYLSALIIGFMICRHIIFKSATESAGKQLAMFLISSIFFRGAEYGASLFLHKELGMHYLSALTIVTCTAFFLKFLYYRTVVFRKGPQC